MVYINILKELRAKSDKFTARNEKGQLIGYTDNKIYIVYIKSRPLKSRVIRTSHIDIINDILNTTNNNKNLIFEAEENIKFLLINL